MFVRACSIAVCALLGASAGWAVDGVVEINQAVVEAAGGFPYVITEPGSYVLTGNLAVDADNTDGIQVRVEHVYIDLNGFVIQGNDTNGFGVTSFSAESNEHAPYLEVRNGTVRDWVFGIFVDVGQVINVRAHSNINGIRGFNATVTGCTASDNTVYGIVARVVRDSEAFNNIGAGLWVGEMATGNWVSGNEGSSGELGDNSGVQILMRSATAGLIKDNAVSGNQQQVAIMIEDTSGQEQPRVGYSGNSVVGLIEGGVAMGCNVINGVLECPLSATE